jgi:hypothetical protein
MIVLQQEHVWASRIWIQGSAHLGYREGKLTMDSLHGKIPYIKLQTRLVHIVTLARIIRHRVQERNRCLQ